MTRSLVEAFELPEYIRRQGCIVVDARGGADAFARYTEGHMENACFADLETELSHKGDDPKDGGRHPLPSPERFARLLTLLGITPESTVIVYDDKSGANAAARFWWMMKAIGHAKVHVVNGGWEAIVKAGLSTSTSSAERKPAPGNYPHQQWTLPLADMADVECARTDPYSIVIDVREAYRFRGESEPIDKVAGHIPGAVNVPYFNNLDKEGRFLDSDSLAALYQPFTGKHVIVHCGSGVTACHTLLAMEEAGIQGAQLYVGSWSEWSRNDKPIASGNT